MDLREFLKAVITSEGDQGWFCLALAPEHGRGFWEKWYQWPDELEKILEDALTYAEDSNVYFSSHLFREPQSTKANVLPTKTIQADLDEADILTLPLQPSVLIKTSADRHQGYWILKGETYLSPDVLEVLSRKLTYAIKDCDTSGWPLGRKRRVPFTINYKYLEGPQQVEIVNSPLKQYSDEELELLPDPPAFMVTEGDIAFLDDLELEKVEAAVGGTGPQELFNQLKAKLPASVQSQYNLRQSDRSTALWSLMCSLFRAGVTRETVWWVAWHSQNNKFADLHFNAERELAKDVLRAEATVRAKIPNSRLEVSGIRKLPHASYERRQMLLQLVLATLKSEGEFIHTPEDLSWFIRSDLGRPVQITPHSEWLDMILDLQFGLNGTETDKAYVAYGLNNFCRSLPINGIQASMSHFDKDNHSLLLHTGKKDVLRITAEDVSKTTDGSYGVVFPWSIGNEPFNPQIPPSPIDWAEIVYGSALGNVIGLSPAQARAILKVWTLFLLFREAAISRPIIAFFGQPGAGKSTLFRRMYTLLYGKQRSLAGITTADNFDQAVSSYPFVVFDNVDVPERWLPDRLALSASVSEFAKRKLYTDNDDFMMRRQACVGITAHNPQFSREDVADRLLLLTFKRLENFVPEGDIINSIHNQRNKLWGQIVLDCQQVLRTPLPNYADVPQFRVEDFARMGYWIASALGFGSDFSEAVGLIGRGQKGLNLEQDAVLVQTIHRCLELGKLEDWNGAGQLWSQFTTYAPDAHIFQRTYRGPTQLAKKLWALQDSLKEVFTIEWKDDRTRGVRLWRISGQPQQRNNGVSGDEVMGPAPAGSAREN